MTVCEGASLAARAGVLDGKRATENKRLWEVVTPTRPDVNWDKGPRPLAGSSTATCGRPAANDIEYEWSNDPNWDVFAYVW